METIDLDDLKRAKYDTLSYTWGSQAKTQSITICGEGILITSNLFNALQHLRLPEVSLVLWVDAICINQDDHAERSSQVELMTKIYKNCEKVHMWLGCSEEFTSTNYNPFSLVEHFRDDKHFFELPGYQWDKNTNSWKCDKRDSSFCTMTDALWAIHESPWWDRAWTAQESILPRAAVFRYGDWILPLGDLWVSRLNRIRHLSNTCCVIAYQEVVFHPALRGFDKMTAIVDSIKSIQDPEGQYKSALDVYRAFSNRKCFDPHDKIYSLLGFLNPRTPKIIPDYTRPVGEVYLETFCAMITEREGQLSTLLGEGFNSGNLDLPSWVPDFSGSYGYPLYHLTRTLRAYPLFNASGGILGKLEILPGKKLQVTGFCLGQVLAKSNFINYNWASNRGEVFEDWRNICYQQGVRIDTTSRDISFSLILAGEMTGDLLTGKYRILQQYDTDLPTNSQWQSYMGRNSDGSTLPRPYRNAVGAMLDRKILFTTSTRNIGLSWPTVKVGDEVWILNGANVPFILRKPLTGERGNNRLIIGDAYIYGVMHGETISKTNKVETIFLI